MITNKKIKKPVCHILAGEIRFKKDKKHDILLSWDPKNVPSETSPHGTKLEC